MIKIDIQNVWFFFKSHTSIHPPPFRNFRPNKCILVNKNKIVVFKISTYVFFQSTFKVQTQLEYLDLSHNGFTKLQPHYFSDLNRLLWLNISHNGLEEMSGRIFARNSLLRVLHMNNNRITRLDANSFRGMRFMRRLYFSDNLINDVGRGTFRAVSRWVRLYLSTIPT